MAEPRFLSREEAAAYLGVSARTFDTELRTGMWPAPLRRGEKQGALTWDRRLLDAAADRHSGLARAPAAQPTDGPTPGEMAALEIASGTTRGQRHQGRHQAPR